MYKSNNYSMISLQTIAQQRSNRKIFHILTSVRRRCPNQLMQAMIVACSLCVVLCNPTHCEILLVHNPALHSYISKSY